MARVIRAVYNPLMTRRIAFLAGALCIIATISLLRLHLIDSEYAAAALSTAPSATVQADTPPASLTVRATSTPLFPIARKIATSSPAAKAPKNAATGATEALPHKATTVTPPQAAVSAPVPTATSADFDAINPFVRNAVVNIACVAPNSDSPISGSGVIIDPRGVILTNAHVGQYVLLQDSGQITLSCTIRTGSPAVDTWHVEVLYISSRWMTVHGKDILQAHQVGTGENDYALLRITGTTNGTPLPASFPSLGINANFLAVSKDQSVEVASYPAGFLGGIEAYANMSLISTVTTIKELFTFSEAHTADLISLGGIIVAQSGSSGGAVVDQWKNLIAIIATSSTADATDGRDLRAITLFHINQSIMEETGLDLATYLSGSLDTREAAFKKDYRPADLKILIDAVMAR
jgi:hypothetical protein